MQQEFMNEVTADEKDINDETFWSYLKCQNPLYLAKDLIRAKHAKNERLLNNINNELIDINNAIIKKEISENENSNKIVDIVETIIEFNKKQKGTGIKLLPPKQVLQRLPMAFVQLKAGNTSENLLNEIFQIIHSLYQQKEITKKGI